MQLERLIAALAPTDVVGGGALEIRELAYDAREVPPDSLFFCVPGARIDGHDLAGEAVAGGAVALVVERRLPLEVPQLVVSSVREAMPQAAVEFFGDPTAELPVAAITGTNGKTTSAYLLWSILAAAGRQSGLDRKSTRLNSSHVAISYAVFCLKKKKKNKNISKNYYI